MTTGACLCGAVCYEVDGPFSLMAHCHCSMCRKHHGSAFATFVSTPLAGFRWTSGADNLGRFKSSEQGERAFCRTCGSVAPVLMPAMDMAIIPAGNLLDPIEIRPQAHWFVGSKAGWYRISDDLPQHEEYPPEFGIAGLLRPEVQARPGTTAGSCLCGQVAFEITGPAQRMANCHCSRCQRARSAAHATNVFYKADDFHYTRGAERVVQYRLPEARFFTNAFCADCGSLTAYVSLNRSLAVVPAGSLDTDPGMQPLGHIFVGSKASWFDISDNLPQFETIPS